MYKQITEQEQQNIIKKEIAKFLQEVATMPPEQQPTELEIALAIHNISHEIFARVHKHNECVKAYNEIFEISDARIERHTTEFDKKIYDTAWRALARS